MPCRDGNFRRVDKGDGEFAVNGQCEWSSGRVVVRVVIIRDGSGDGERVVAGCDAGWEENGDSDCLMRLAQASSGFYVPLNHNTFLVVT